MPRNLDYGIIGNCKSAALISRSGCIEWCCLPDFDSASVFAKLLDSRRGGEFAIHPQGGYVVTQNYIPRTNILATRFKNRSAEFEALDFMPRYKSESGTVHNPPDMVRYLRRIRGNPAIRITYDPRPCYSQYPVKTEIHPPYIKTYTEKGTYESVYLYSNLDLETVAEGKPFRLRGDAYLLMSYNQKLVPLDQDFIRLEFEKTKVYWMDWSAKSKKFKLYNEEILRSALVLKLLTFQKTGAIIAAPTTSLPESLGGRRNWDYRYCWIRDASMIMAILTRLNHSNSARRFIDFVLSIVPFKDENIQIMYGINGQKRLTEKILPFLEGYERSAPVRIGNAAYLQKQNDIFGILLDSVYQYLVAFWKQAEEQREKLWTVVRAIARHVERNWYKTDMGIWEFRHRKKHFTFSKVLSWVAIERARRIAFMFGQTEYAKRWNQIQTQIYHDIYRKAWNPRIKAFTQSYGDANLDASVLLMEHYRFISPDDPKYIHTVQTLYNKLTRNGLVYRYRNHDDFGLPQSAFLICSFWMVRSLYKIGMQEKARMMFDSILSHGNHLGLFSEDMDFKTKRLLGNFQQAYSHLALIDVALTLAGEEMIY